MSRPCFPFPVQAKEGVIWAGGYTGPDDDGNYIMVGPAGEDTTLLCGNGTQHPIGFTFKQLVFFLFRVRLWKLTFSLTGGSKNYVISLSSPVISGQTYSYENATPSLSYAGVQDNNPYYMTQEMSTLGQGAQCDVSSEGVSLPAFSAGIANYTALELNALLSGSGARDGAGGTRIATGSGVGLRWSQAVYLEPSSSAPYDDVNIVKITTGGVVTYYPFLRFNWRGAQQGGFTNQGEFPQFVAPGSTTGEATLTLNLGIYGTLSCQIYGKTSDITVSALLEPVKFWPYKNAAGTALYNETTGALV